MPARHIMRCFKEGVGREMGGGRIGAALSAGANQVSGKLRYVDL